MNLHIDIAGISFTNCLMNASGARCRTVEELQTLIEGGNGSWVSKSATLRGREGNPKPRYYDTPLGSINSMGLPNLGLATYLNFALEHQSSKPGFLSLAGLSLEENLEMLKMVQDSEYQGLVELNLSCPNIAGKPQTGYDFERTQEVLEKTFQIYHKPLGVKLPPYFDEVHFQMIAAILNSFPLQFVTCINSIGNGLYIDVEKEQVVIKPKSGLGGIGGAYVKPTALANVYKMHQLLLPDIAVIGCGGIASGKDAFEHILCGASMLQIGTQLMKEGGAVFLRIEKELMSIMETKGYKQLSDFRGKLKTLV